MDNKMANLRVPEHLRLILKAAESPTILSSMEGVIGISPVTNLAMNLSGTSLGSTPRRRLSLSSLDNTPNPVQKISFSDTDTPISSEANRLLKNSIKLSNNTNGGNSSRSRGLSRRININLSTSPHNDKENMGCGAEDVLLSSPTKPTTTTTSTSPSKFAVSRLPCSPRPRQPLEDQDPNSQDSGYGTFVDKDDIKSGFRFAEPNGLAPRKHSPTSSPQVKSRSLFHSLSSGSESVDDGFTDLLDLDKVDETTYLPSGINSLLSGPIKDHHSMISHSISPKEDRIKPIFQRSFSLVENVTPASSRARHRLFKSQADEQEEGNIVAELDSLRSFKRPEPPAEIAPLHAKRRKSSSLHSIRENISPTPSLQRSFSETEATIKRALQRSTQIPDLIGDFTKPFILPLMEGRHQDLKTISAETLASVLSGQYDKDVESYSIIDCRYPYEYDGGHIKGARNIYTKEQIMKEFVEINESTPRSPSNKIESNEGKRNILIFHCEFSSERGPNLFRFLRNSDRDQNKELYPALNYPELYLLDGGYKKFYERHSSMCEPCAYRPMLDPNHETDLRLFRSKSKSWNGDSKSRLALRSSLKRLGL